MKKYNVKSVNYERDIYNLYHMELNISKRNFLTEETEKSSLVKVRQCKLELSKKWWYLFGIDEI